MAVNKIFGIDLGTTYSCIAYVDEYGKAVTIQNGEQEKTTPSVVYFESAQKQIVGSEAKVNAVLEPENTVSFIKREMGTDFRREIHGDSYSPQEISGKILTKLVNDANATLREQGILKQDEEPIKKAVITCPAYFGMAEKEATKCAGEEFAGLEVLDIINEPTAAAINYGILNADQKGKKNILVYDLGGGTFDVTIITVDNNSISVICTGGDPMLGGKDWDSALKDYFVQCWQEEMDTSEDISENLETMSALMENAEKAKKSLTTKESTKVNLIHEGDRMKVELSREKYNEVTKHLLARTLELTDACLEAAKEKGYSLQDVDEILLVGGSSRMPQVKTAVEEKYQKPTYLFDPDEAVAKGAALYAQKLDMIDIVIEEIARKTRQSKEEVQEQINDGKSVEQMAKNLGVKTAAMSGAVGGLAQMTINNVSSRTYGVDVVDINTGRTYISNFIFQNDVLPKTDTQTFATLNDNQSGTVFDIYESIGHEPRIDNLDTATKITSIQMDFVEAVPKGTKIVTTIRLENSGLLFVEAEEMLNHSKLNASYEIKNALSKTEMAAARGRVGNSTVE